MKQQLRQLEFIKEEMGLNHIFKWCLDKKELILASTRTVLFWLQESLFQKRRLFLQTLFILSMQVYHLTHLTLTGYPVYVVE